MQYVTLYNGVKMPQLGYGVYLIGKEECERCVLDALETGYRHIDTAQAYGNEDEVAMPSLILAYPGVNCLSQAKSVFCAR